MGNLTGEGELTTIHDRVNFYKDVKNDPGVHFKREGNNIALIDGDGTIINDKLIAKSEDAFNHEFDTYIPLKTKLTENQQKLLKMIEKAYTDQASSFLDYRSQYDEGFLDGMEAAENVVKNFYRDKEVAE